MTGPGLRHRKRVHTVITNPDIATTIAKLAGAKPGLRVDGVNILPYTRTGYRERVIPIEGYPVWGGRRPLYTGVRVGKWTYVNLRGHEELYNLRVDRWQLSNLARLERFRGDLVWLRRLNRRYHDCAAASCMRTYLTRARMDAQRQAVVAAVKARVHQPAQPAQPAQSASAAPSATPGDRAAGRLAGAAKAAARH
jgi:arylsulfatase A-like enzyme